MRLAWSGTRHFLPGTKRRLETHSMSSWLVSGLLHRSNAISPTTPIFVSTQPSLISWKNMILPARQPCTVSWTSSQSSQILPTWPNAFRHSYNRRSSWRRSSFGARRTSILPLMTSWRFLTNWFTLSVKRLQPSSSQSQRLGCARQIFNSRSKIEIALKFCRKRRNSSASVRSTTSQGYSKKSRTHARPWVLVL